MLFNPTVPTVGHELELIRTAARTLGVQVQFLSAVAEPDLETAFMNVQQLQSAGLVVAADPFFSTRAERIAALTIQYRIPAIWQNRDFVKAGGLMSYGTDPTRNAQAGQVVGTYTGRILMGEKPADLPVQLPTRFEFFINLKTAKALGLTFPLSLLGRADEVIE
jgi:putative ABC transport system substrate-binding protein